MKKTVFFIFAIVSLFLISCDHNDSDDMANSEIDAQIKNALVGNWNWVRSDGGFGFHIHDTPSSTGNDVTFKITGDFKYEILVNGISKSVGTYVLSLQNSIYSTEKQVHIQISDENNIVAGVVINGFIVIDEIGSLHISDNFHDGIGSEFSK